MKKIFEKWYKKMEDRYLFKGKEKDSGKWLKWNAVAGVPHNVSILTDTICRCTGSKDKNGNLIWENDIVKFKRSDDKEFVGEISYVEHYGAFFVIHSGCSDNQLYAFGDYEVIGNIFDNPELLERGCKNDCK